MSPKNWASGCSFFRLATNRNFTATPTTVCGSEDWNFEKYLAQWMTFAKAVIARVPEARFGGPDVGSNAQWVTQFAREASLQLPGRIVACTSHYYVMGPPDNPRVTAGRLLAPDRRVNQEVPRIIRAANEAHLAYRMTEGNSCYRGGKPGVSNAFCSALWAADYLLKLASFGCAGVNLHGGGAGVIRGSLGGHLPGEKLSADAAAIAAEGSFYTPIAGSREKGFNARPVFYGMKLAGVLAGGRMRPAQLRPVSGQRQRLGGGHAGRAHPSGPGQQGRQSETADIHSRRPRREFVAFAGAGIDGHFGRDACGSGDQAWKNVAAFA